MNYRQLTLSIAPPNSIWHVFCLFRISTNTNTGENHYFRCMFTILISYLILFGDGRVTDLCLEQIFILAFIFFSLIFIFLPQAWFSNPKLFYSLVVIDTGFVSFGMYLPEKVTKDFYFIFFLILILASVSRNYKLLMTIYGTKASLCRVFLYKWGLLG